MRFNTVLHGMPAILLAVVGLVGCVSTPRLDAVSAEAAIAAPVAAQFRTTLTTQVDGQRHTETSDWRLWRDGDRVQRELLATHRAEVWQRDGAALFHTLLFHDDRRGIEFEPVDLQMVGAQSSWRQCAQVVSPDLLSRLTAIRGGRSRGIDYVDYAGAVGDSTWRIRMRTDVALPLRVERRGPRETLRIDLTEMHALADAPWQPTSSTGYDMLDFADLGDHERDPFVQRLQALDLLDLDHGHRH